MTVPKEAGQPDRGRAHAEEQSNYNCSGLPRFIRDTQLAAYLVADPDIGIGALVPIRKLARRVLPLLPQKVGDLVSPRVLRHLLGGAPFLRERNSMVQDWLSDRDSNVYEHKPFRHTAQYIGMCCALPANWDTSSQLTTCRETKK